MTTCQPFYRRSDGVVTSNVRSDGIRQRWQVSSDETEFLRTDWLRPSRGDKQKSDCVVYLVQETWLEPVQTRVNA